VAQLVSNEGQRIILQVLYYPTPTTQTTPIIMKSAELIAERLPSISTAEAESSPPQIFVDGRKLPVNT
jgi:hypothetical protein